MTFVFQSALSADIAGMELFGAYDDKKSRLQNTVDR